MSTELKNILFFTYLTGYNIEDIFYGIENNFHPENAYIYLEYISEKRKYKLTTVQIQNAILKAKFETDICIEKLKYFQIKTVTCYSKNYPKKLINLSNKPPVLFYKGNLKKIDSKSAAVIGTREISNKADNRTEGVVNVLTDNGYGIVSGLAFGIDKIAHEKALKNKAYTIAVLPTSLDHIYPVENLYLANQILHNDGLLISELAIGINRGKKSFVERNRIQAALSDVVVPIEMGTSSGTMHTIRFSKTQKKIIYLLKPAPVDEKLPQYEGILSLIEEQKQKKKNNVIIIESKKEFKQSIENLDKENPLSNQLDLQL